MYTILGGTPANIADFSIRGELPVDAGEVLANAAKNKLLGHKTYRSWRGAQRLAVVGGGPSINEHLDTLRGWDGDVWAINGAWKWCRDNGIEATFFACDPHPIVSQWASGASRALLEISCHPSAFDVLSDIYTFDADVENGGIASVASTASCAPHLAIRMGYRSVTFFGCESSYPPNASHAYMNEARSEQMIVRCNGEDYLTAPDLFLQAIGLSEFIRGVPEFLSEKCGGLLRAMVSDPKTHVAWLSQSLVDSLEKPSKPLVSPAYKKVSGAIQMADNLEAFGINERDVA